MSVERLCVLVGVTGCIAAYKAGEIVRGLQKAVVARAVVESKSSAMPQATFAITLAVHGAIRNTSHS